MNSSIFKAYDVRGIYPTDVNEEVAINISKACVELFKTGTVVIAHDIRHGSEDLARVLEKNIEQESKGEIKVVFVGLSTTPMFYFLVNHFKASGGCMVTASHNPKNYNGFKIVAEGAQTISGIEVKETIEKLNIQ
jgi:phosphomannomutase